MKRTIYILTLFALALSSCSMKEEAFDQETSEGIPGTYQVSINAGPEDQTKAISIGGNTGNRLYTNWDNGDAVQVVNSAGDMVGTLTANQSAGNSAYAKLGGTLTGTFAVNDVVTLCYHTADMDYTGQVGTLANVSTSKSYLTATSTVQAVNVGSGTIQDEVGYLSMSDATFTHQQAYLDLTFMADDGATPLQITSLEIWTDGGKLVKTKALDGTTVYATEDSPLIITPAAPSTKFFLALRDENGAANNYHFKATVTDGYKYRYDGSKNIEHGHYYTNTLSMNLTETLSIPLTFEAKTAGSTVSFYDDISNVKYSFNGTSWLDYENISITLANVGDRVMFCGHNASYVGHRFVISGSCYIYGNIMSLIDWSCYSIANELTEDNCFLELFANTNVYNHPKFPLLLPATTLTPYCYSYMFSETKLTSAPALPAETLAESCYSSMFASCIDLTEAPVLSAENLATECYLEMFSECTNLATAPALPATTIAPKCYYNMFLNCTSLTAAPALPAMEVCSESYRSMFSGCTHLQTAPELPATTLAASCYRNMFYGCTSLTATPTLPAKTLTSNCYDLMFYGCTNLTTVTCFATTNISSETINNWLGNVSGSGTFIMNSNPAISPWTSGIPSGWKVIPALPGQFTVAPNKKVAFSQGNLLYDEETWSFHTDQYERCANESSDYTYEGTFDLFGWGTSGYNHGATCYLPYSTDASASKYYAYGSDILSLDADSGQADWGYNAISNGGNVENGGWRTLARSEWNYLFNTRTTRSNNRFARAVVNGIGGVILLPDDWDTSYHELNSTNNGSVSFTENNITGSDWASDFQVYGAVFLPAVGYRYGTGVFDADYVGVYWASTPYANNPDAADCLYFDEYPSYSTYSLTAEGSADRHFGGSVRLVINVN